MKIELSEVCTDLEFIRRVYLDLTGLPPSPDDYLNNYLVDRVNTFGAAWLGLMQGRPSHVDTFDPKPAMAENTTRAFLGMSINCAKCHNHPMEKRTNTVKKVHVNASENQDL